MAVVDTQPRSGVSPDSRNQTPTKIPTLQARPSLNLRSATAPHQIPINAHMAQVGQNGTANFEHGVQVIDEDKEFNPDLGKYLKFSQVDHAGFNYHLVSVFGSQSTGKSTLLNALFGTSFNVMSETERRQTTKGIWLSKNKSSVSGMAENILVMDVEGTDGRERGEDQDFERKSSLFALATSEVLMVNIWEHQVGLYQGANMGLLKTVFEVNLQLFLKDRKSQTRSLIYFVIRDFIGTTPLQNLRNTLMADLSKIWAGLNKPQGLESSRIEDYFDFAFTALPHKVYAAPQFDTEVKKMATRFRAGERNPRKDAVLGISSEFDGGIFQTDYHRRIPADGLPMYAQGIWDQIVDNKDLDLPTQQELLAQFRCDEIMRETMVAFDEVIQPFEAQQTKATALGNPEMIDGLGAAMQSSRGKALTSFDTEAGRYHKGVYTRKRAELESKIDTRLKTLFQGQLTAVHKRGITRFGEAVSAAVKLGQKKGTASGSGTAYDFASIVAEQKGIALEAFDTSARAASIEGVSWSNYTAERTLYGKDLDKVSTQLRRDEMRRLTARTERWIKNKLNDSVALEFNNVASPRNSTVDGKHVSEEEIWDRIWNLFTGTVNDAQTQFSTRAASFDASEQEIASGVYRLRRRSWQILKSKVLEEESEGNLLLKLRENFEERFRYDEAGVPRIWRPSDDIEGLFQRARSQTLGLIPLLSKFQLHSSHSPPPLSPFIGDAPALSVDDNTIHTTTEDENEQPIGGVDPDAAETLEDETTILTDTKRSDLTVRFRKAAESIFIEAKRSTVSGITQVPLYFYGLLLALGWNEIVAVLRNPVYFIFLALLGVGAYVIWSLNLSGPLINMTSAAGTQALEEGKKRLREFLESNETARQAVGMTTKAGESFELGSMSRNSTSGASGVGNKKVEEDDEI